MFILSASHAIRVAIDEAFKCKETGEAKNIVFGLTGTGYFDLMARLRTAYFACKSPYLLYSDISALLIEFILHFPKSEKLAGKDFFLLEREDGIIFGECLGFLIKRIVQQFKAIAFPFVIRMYGNRTKSPNREDASVLQGESCLSSNVVFSSGLRVCGVMFITCLPDLMKYIMLENSHESISLIDSSE